MIDCEKKIADTGILPVINIPELTLAKPLARAISDGGISAMEVTLRSECSLAAISEIKSEFPDFAVGAGTVLSIETAKAALAAGTDFIVTPGYDDEIVDFCIEQGVPIYPGCSTPSEIQRGIKKGLRVFKFFPSELSGGTAAIKLISGPYPKIKFLPTGGINFSNLSDYLSTKAVTAVGGSFMATAEQLRQRDFDGIRKACLKAVKISLGFELAHIGINHETADQAQSTASQIAEIFDFAVQRDGEASVFAGNAVEAMKSQYFGTRGHIGYYTNSVERAIAWFERNNVPLKYDSIKYNPDNSIVSIYLDKEIEGFALHVVAR